MKRSISVAVLVLFFVGAFGAASWGEKPRPTAHQLATNLGILKLYPSKESVGVLLNAESPPKIFLDGEFVGNYDDPTEYPACFRLPVGKHTVRVEFGSKDYSPFQSEISLIGNETTQFLCVTLEDQSPNRAD